MAFSPIPYNPHGQSPVGRRPLVLTDEAAESRLFGVGSAMRAMVTSNAGLAMENHASGVSLDVWQASAKLTVFFRVVSLDAS